MRKLTKFVMKNEMDIRKKPLGVRFDNVVTSQRAMGRFISYLVFRTIRKISHVTQTWYDIGV